MKPLITVIIPTYQKRESLSHLAQSLNRQSYSNFKVIIADNGSTQSSIKHVEKCLKGVNFPYIIKGLKQNLGPGNARNIAIKDCDTKYVAFTDDDCIAPPTWLETTVTSLNNNDCVYGPVSSDVAPLNPFIHAFSMESNKVFGAGNCAFKTDYFKSIGGFNPNMNNWGEDYELSQRINEKAVYIKDMLIDHPPKIINYTINYGLHSHNWLDKFYYLDYRKINHKFNYVNQSLFSFLKKGSFLLVSFLLAIKFSALFIFAPLALSILIFLKKTKETKDHLQRHHSSLTVSSTSILKYSLYYWITDALNVGIIISYKVKRGLIPKKYEEITSL